MNLLQMKVRQNLSYRQGYHQVKLVLLTQKLRSQITSAKNTYCYITNSSKSGILLFSAHAIFKSLPSVTRG